MWKIVNRAKGDTKEETEKKKKEKSILQIQDSVRYSVSLLSAEFDLFVFTDCRPLILTHSLVKSVTKGKYLNTFTLI